MIPVSTRKARSHLELQSVLLSLVNRRDSTDSTETQIKDARGTLLPKIDKLFDNVNSNYQYGRPNGHGDNFVELSSAKMRHRGAMRLNSHSCHTYEPDHTPPFKHSLTENECGKTGLNSLSLS